LSLKKKFEEIMSAIAFAEAGEAETARRELAGKKVLLVMTGVASDRRSLKYAMNTARRVEASIEVLFLARDGTPFPQEFKALLEGEGLDYSIERKKGCLREKLIDFIGKRKDILFVVAESKTVLNAGCEPEEKELKGAWKRLTCPLVLVSELQGA
jgi:hypothetical protein